MVVGLVGCRRDSSMGGEWQVRLKVGPAARWVGATAANSRHHITHLVRHVLPIFNCNKCNLKFFHQSYSFIINPFSLLVFKE